jgi:hypothetical protein
MAAPSGRLGTCAGRGLGQLALGRKPSFLAEILLAAKVFNSIVLLRDADALPARQGLDGLNLLCFFHGLGRFLGCHVLILLFSWMAPEGGGNTYMQIMRQS